MARRWRPIGVLAVVIAVIAMTVHLLGNQPTRDRVRTGEGSQAPVARVVHAAPPHIGRIIRIDAPSEPWHGDLAAITGGIPPALARAYAARGAWMDGMVRDMPALDAEAQRWLPEAEALLGAEPLRAGGGRPTVTASGTFSIGPPPFPRHPIIGMAPSAGEDAAPAMTTVPPSPDPTPVGSIAIARPDAGVQNQAIDHGGVAVQTTMAPVPRTPSTIIDDGLRKDIFGNDAWGAIFYHPAQVAYHPLDIADHSQGGHAIALTSDDFSTVRLNGGMVVPGRFYSVGSGAIITSTVPVNVVIRPLSAVPTYSETPARMPTGNG